MYTYMLMWRLSNKLGSSSMPMPGRHIETRLGKLLVCANNRCDGSACTSSPLSVSLRVNHHWYSQVWLEHDCQLASVFGDIKVLQSAVVVSVHSTTCKCVVCCRTSCHSAHISSSSLSCSSCRLSASDRSCSLRAWR